MSKNQLANEFSQVFLQMVDAVSKVRPDSVVAKHARTIQMRIKLPMMKKAAIELFIRHFMAYKKNIDAWDDSFLETIDLKSSCKGNNKIIGIMRELIDTWKSLEADDRFVMFRYFQILSVSAYDYLVLIDNELNAKPPNPEISRC